MRLGIGLIHNRRSSYVDRLSRENNYGRGHNENCNCQLRQVTCSHSNHLARRANAYLMFTEFTSTILICSTRRDKL